MLVPPGPAKVNVVVLSVAGFIALLNVAVMTAVVGQMRVEAFGGVSLVTVGGVVGAPAFAAPEFLSMSPHPATRTASSNAKIQILPIIKLRISCSSLPATRHSRFLFPAIGIIGNIGI